MTYLKHTFNIVRWVLPLIMLALVTGCSGDNPYGSSSTGPSEGGSGPGANEVWMQGIAFNPGQITVSAGTTVTWTNKDNVIHTATSGTPGNPSGLFNSGNMGNGATFSYTFDTPGTFDYYCIPHSSTMTGQVIVQ